MIKSLALNNFRGFRDLTLEELGTVNLVVGRNNSGKTSLLEGIAMLGCFDENQGFPEMFRSLGQNSTQTFVRWVLRDGEKSADIRPNPDSGYQKLSLERQAGSQQLKLNFGGAENPHFYNHNPHFLIHSSQDGRRPSISVISVQPRTAEEIVHLFGAAVDKKGGEERMDALFKEMDDRIRKVRVSAVEGLQVRFDLGLSEMIPMSQMGQGVQHLIRIFSDLIAEAPDICLIDEIENGIHHSMLEQVWSGLAVAAGGLNTQIFATTHSYECIEAAHEAFSKRDNYDLRIVQLFRVADGVQGRVLDQKHIAAALAGDIDLR